MEFTREKLVEMSRAGTEEWRFMGEAFEVRALAEFAVRQLDRAEVAEGWSIHWKGEAERLERELYLARFQHANREAPIEQNPTLSETEADLRENAYRKFRDGVQSAAEKPISEVETKFYLDGERVPMAPESPATELFDSGPQRPHESLVWAIYHSAYTGDMDERMARKFADHDLAAWRHRWPEESE